jgi:hypothetical protein
MWQQRNIAKMQLSALGTGGSCAQNENTTIANAAIRRHEDCECGYPQLLTATMNMTANEAICNNEILQ